MRRRWRLGVAVGAVCVAAAVVATSESTRPTAAGRTGHVALSSAPTPPPVLAPSGARVNAAAQMFKVFDKPARAADSLPKGSAYADGVSRRIGNEARTFSAWAVVTADQVCVTVNASSGAASGGPAACNTTAELSKPDQLLTLQAQSSDSTYQAIAGIAPQGVSSVTIYFSDGSSTLVPVVNNGFTDSAPDTKTVTKYSWLNNGIANAE